MNLRAASSTASSECDGRLRDNRNAAKARECLKKLRGVQFLAEYGCGDEGSKHRIGVVDHGGICQRKLCQSEEKAAERCKPEESLEPQEFHVCTPQGCLIRPLDKNATVDQGHNSADEDDLLA